MDYSNRPWSFEENEGLQVVRHDEYSRLEALPQAKTYVPLPQNEALPTAEKETVTLASPALVAGVRALVLKWWQHPRRRWLLIAALIAPIVILVFGLGLGLGLKVHKAGGSEKGSPLTSSPPKQAGSNGTAPTALTSKGLFVPDTDASFLLYQASNGSLMHAVYIADLYNGNLSLNSTVALPFGAANGTSLASNVYVHGPKGLIHAIYFNQHNNLADIWLTPGELNATWTAGTLSQLSIRAPPTSADPGRSRVCLRTTWTPSGVRLWAGGVDNDGDNDLVHQYVLDWADTSQGPYGTWNNSSAKLAGSNAYGACAALLGTQPDGETFTVLYNAGSNGTWHSYYVADNDTQANMTFFPSAEMQIATEADSSISPARNGSEAFALGPVDLGYSGYPFPPFLLYLTPDGRLANLTLNENKAKDRDQSQFGQLSVGSQPWDIMNGSDMAMTTNWQTVIAFHVNKVGMIAWDLFNSTTEHVNGTLDLPM